MGMKKVKGPSEKEIRALLEKHGCPMAFHEVRTRFLGNIATPELGASPMRAVEALWGGELPAFDNMEEANELIGTLLHGLWNDLGRHQKRSQPFRLTRPPTEPTAANLERYARVRFEELHGFIEGLFNGADAIDLPERAHEAVGNLTELRSMMAGVRDLASRENAAEDPVGVAGLLGKLREASRIIEIEINAAVLSCTRARRQGLAALLAEAPTVH